MEIIYWLFIKPFGFKQEPKCTNCTKHHYPSPTHILITTFVQGSAIAALLIFTVFRFYLVIDRLLNPPIPEDARNQMEYAGSALPLGGEAPPV